MRGRVSIGAGAGVGEFEAAAIRQAADMLGGCLAEADGPVISVDDAGAGSARSVDLLITSMLGEAMSMDEAWPLAEARLRALYRDLSGQVAGSLYVCTVLRVPPITDDRPEADRRRERIRRLNRLVADLSHETGVLVIDLDRTLADIGARTLDTDCRLGGEAARRVAAHCIATTLLANGFDDFVAFETLDAAQRRLAARSPWMAGASPGPLIGAPAAMVTAGRRIQHAERITANEWTAGLYVREVVSGRIPLRDLWRRLSRALNRRGPRYVTRFVITGLAQLARRPGRKAT